MISRFASIPVLAALTCLAAAVPSASLAQASGEQSRLRSDSARKGVMSLRDIEGRVLPLMRGKQYLGPEYDPAAMAYRLKFIDQGRVLFVDVDARTGRVIGRSR